MTRKEAITAIRCFMCDLTEGCQEAIKVLIPELAESEDEKREKAIAILKQQRDFWDYEGQKDKCPPAVFRRDLVEAIDIALAYLEKQKDSPMPEDTVVFQKGVEEGRRLEREDMEKERLPIIETYQRSWYMEGYYDGKLKKEPRWIIKTQGICTKYEENPKYGQSIEEEQKPLPSFDDLTPDEKMNHPLYLEGFDAGREVGRVEAEQKPEWSEEDEKMRQRIIRHIESEYQDWCKDKYGNSEIVSDGKESCQERIAWLKSLRPPQYCEDCKLKRSVGNWKPSKAQMRYLLAVINDPNNIGAESCYMTIKSLYNDLKKL